MWVRTTARSLPVRGGGMACKGGACRGGGTPNGLASRVSSGDDGTVVQNVKCTVPRYTVYNVQQQTVQFVVKICLARKSRIFGSHFLTSPMKTTLSTLLSLPVTDVLGGGADLRLLSEYPSAVCLDGSSAGYYFRPGSVASKWLFSLEGGGECVNKEDCAARAQGDLGSSLAYPATVDLKGLQTADSTVNPFAGWNQVHIKYCSGDLHMGQQEVASDGMDGMKFAGHLIVDSVLEELRAKENLGSADTVIWSG